MYEWSWRRPQRPANGELEIGARGLQIGGSLDRSQSHITRRLHGLEVGGNSGLSKAIGILGHALELERLRDNLVAITDELLPLRFGDGGRRGDLTGDPCRDGLTLAGQLRERGVLDPDGGAVGGEDRNRDRQRRPPSCIEFGFGATS